MGKGRDALRITHVATLFKTLWSQRLGALSSRQKTCLRLGIGNGRSLRRRVTKDCALEANQGDWDLGPRTSGGRDQVSPHLTTVELSPHLTVELRCLMCCLAVFSAFRQHQILSYRSAIKAQVSSVKWSYDSSPWLFPHSFVSIRLRVLC